MQFYRVYSRISHVHAKNLFRMVARHSLGQNLTGDTAVDVCYFKQATVKFE